MAIAETYRFGNPDNLPVFAMGKLIDYITEYRDGLIKFRNADERLFDLAKGYVDKTYKDGILKSESEITSEDI